ncbi:MAG TPA: hypothetical protein VHE83_15985 [Mycobacteriales bacterium]|nr:hypothetical protein [Mycobacteriales bacterium]
MIRLRALAPVVLATAAAVTASTATAAPSHSAAAKPIPVKTGYPAVTDTAWVGQEIASARTADGVLHVVWIQGSNGSTIHEDRFSPAGKLLGTSTVATGWDGNGGLALVVQADGSLRLLVAGGYQPNLPPSQSGVNSFTAPATGQTWTRDTSAIWGGTLGDDSGQLGAVEVNGTLVSSYAAAGGVRVHVGLGPDDPNHPDPVYGTDLGGATLSEDAKTQAVVLSAVTIAGNGGTFVQQVYPTPGAQQVIPSGLSARSSGGTARTAGPGVYVAYATSSSNAVRLARYGGGSIAITAGPHVMATACAGPDGRVWVVWGNDNDGLFATRTNKAVTRIEPVQHFLPPKDNLGVGETWCAGDLGPVDVFPILAIGAARGVYHLHTVPRLTVTLSVGPKGKNGKRTVTVHVTDAGDPVKGATVGSGPQSKKTNGSGVAKLTLGPGKHTISALAPTYAKASVSVTLG